MENGHESTRLDRIEKVIEQLAQRQVVLESSQESLVRSQSQLLQAQVLMVDEVRGIAVAQKKMADEIQGIAVAQKKTEAALATVTVNLAALTLKCDETTDKLNGLIDLVARHVSGN